MSEKFLTALALAALAGAAIYLLRDRIPSPNVSPDRPFIASTKQRVFPAFDGGPSFEVMSLAGAGPAQYFCAAAEYARMVLRAEMGDSIVILQPLGPSDTLADKQSVFFEHRAVADAPAPEAGVTLDLGRVGTARSVAFALQLCNR